MTTPVQFPIPDLPVLSSYARIRESAPVVRLELPGGVQVWAVTDHAALAELLAKDNKTVSRDPRHWPGLTDGTVPADWPLRALIEGDHLQLLDGQPHRRMRSLLSGAFTAARIEALAPLIGEITGELLEEMVAAGEEADLVSAFTAPLPVSVICDLYGVPKHERGPMRTWVETLFGLDSTAEQTAAANQDMGAYLAEFVERKRREPGEDLTSGLIDARDQDGGRLSTAELVASLWVLLVAGHETTVHMLGNAIVALCTHPDQRALATTQDRWDDVVEETLRHRNSVLTSLFRYTVQDITIAGVPIPAGQPIMTIYAGAGTDPAHYGPDAHTFDINRTDKTHLSFGHGPHFCLGAPLARLEGRIALKALFTRLPDLQLTLDPQQLTHTNSLLTFGPVALPAKLGHTT